MTSIKKFKYKLIKNFFSEEEINILKLYCIKRLNEDWTCDSQSPFTPSWREDILMNTLLETKLPRVEKETKLKLFKTYAYWRYYMHGSLLKDHKDRPSCEISVSACIHKTEDWPIHMEGNWMEIEEGDAVIYLGCQIEHGRKQFKGDGCAQVFMHYVDAHGEYSNFKDDNKYAIKEWKKNNDRR
tara:strand:+ start:685 stop:1236 length:552 start_codon:yes stop_codon:yes gene_type:complete